MVGRRALVAVLAAAAAVLGTSQASSGVETAIPAEPGAQSQLAAPPISQGETVRTAGASDSMVSGDGRWQIYAAGGLIYVRDLVLGSTRQVSYGRNDLSNGSTVDGSPGQVTTPDGTQPARSSTLPSISNDGRYFSFITLAMNVVPAPPAIEGTDATLVVCDRDPGGLRDENWNWILDSALPGKDYPNYRCESVYSSYNGFYPDLAEDQRPRLSGDGHAIVYTLNESATSHSIWTSPVSGWNGLAAPNSVRVGVGTPDGTVYPDAVEPWLNEDGTKAYFISSDGTTSSVVQTNVATQESTRVDIAPADEGGGFLGDYAGTPFSSLTVSDDGNLVAFQRTTAVVNFRGPLAAAAGTPPAGPYVYLVNIGAGTSQLVSRDNDDAPVFGYSVALSGDGRYIAFETDTNSSSDATGGSGRQVVERDLTVDASRTQAGQSRLPGALVTVAADCAGGTHCASTNTPPDSSKQPAVTSLSIDRIGFRIGFDTAIGDLVAGDSNAQSDAFVRTWQPTVVATVKDFGTVQSGANSTQDVPVQVTGFGPLVIDQVSLDGADADQFGIVGNNCDGAAIHTNDSCTVSVRFSPTSNGAKTASLAVASAQLANAQTASTLTATATPDGPKNAPATTVRTSVDAQGGQAASGGDESMISGNGRWDVFVSRSDLLGRKAVSDEPDRSNVYVRDLNDPQNTVQISLHSVFGSSATDASKPAKTDNAHPTGTDPNSDSYWPSISSDGRFVSFLTDASDVVPLRKGGDNNPGVTNFTTLAVCDRDPDGDGRFDELQPGTKLPDYRCYAVESGSYFDDGINLDLGSRPMLSGDGSRITWVESADTATDSQRVRYADLPRQAKGALESPTNFSYLKSGVPGFEHGSGRDDDSNVQQTLPVLNEDGTKLVYYAVQHPIEGPAGFAVIEADLSAGSDQRVDGLGDDNSADGVELEHQPAVSDDGTRVAYDYYNSDAGAFQVYVTTIRNGAITRQLESRNNDGEPANGSQPALSGDGRYLAFVTQAANMSNGVDPPVNSSSTAGCVDGPTETEFGVICQVVARDLVRDQQREQEKIARLPNELVSTAVPGTACPNVPKAGRLCGGDASSSNPSIDNTGSEIGFDSGADDLVTGDTNNTAGGSEFAALGSAPTFIDYTTDTFVHTWRPTLTAQPVNFGPVRLGKKKDKAVRTGVEVLGASQDAFGPVSLGKARIDGTDSGDFTIRASTCDGQTLHAGPPDGQPLTANPETCTVTVRFKPSAPGTRTANLRLPIGKNSYPRVIRNPTSQVIVQQFDPAALRALTGVGALPIGTPNPSTIDFGTPLPQDPTTKTATITNTGSAPLVITSGTVDDTTVPGAKGDYTVDLSGCTAPLPPGGSCAITVTFTGSRVGVRNAVLVLTDNTLTGSTSIGLQARIKKPTVDSNPAVSPVRRVIVVTGRGFAPNHDVEIGFDQQPQMTVRAKANGSFVAYMVVLPNGPQGPRLLFGHSAGFSKTIGDDFPFLVVLGSTDPGLGVVLRD